MGRWQYLLALKEYDTISIKKSAFGMFVHVCLLNANDNDCNRR
jgi:hypothetical protein